MKAKTFIAAIMVFGAGLMISCDSTGEEKEYIILNGRVTQGDTAVYISGAIVIDGMNSSMVDTTDERGYFQLRGIDKAKHPVRISKTGYEPKEVEIEYTGELKRPLISKHIVMTPAAEK